MAVRYGLRTSRGEEHGLRLRCPAQFIAAHHSQTLCSDQTPGNELPLDAVNGSLASSFRLPLFLWWNRRCFGIPPEKQNRDQEQRRYKDVSGYIKYCFPDGCLLRRCADQGWVEAGNDKV